MTSADDEPSSASQQHARATMPCPGVAALSAIVLSCGAATMDLVAVPKAASALLGTVLLAVGLAQLGLAVIILMRCTRRWMLAAGTVSATVVLYWAVTRSTGLLLGAGSGMVGRGSVGADGA